MHSGVLASPLPLCLFPPLPLYRRHERHPLHPRQRMCTSRYRARKAPCTAFKHPSTGQLSAIPGAPWKPAGQIVGATPTKFFTAGKDLIHSYGIGADGAIEPQSAQMPIFEYAGSVCGSPTNGLDGAVLDHSGEYMFV